MSNFTYELPENFKKRINQYLHQKYQPMVDAFSRCTFEYQDQGLAYYAGLKGDNWDKRAIDITLEGTKEDIDLLKRRKKDLSDSIGKAIKPDVSGLLLREIYFLLGENVTIDICDEIENKFIEISNRQATFEEMSTDEKLAEIVNLLENMLKDNGKFVTLSYPNICFDYISDDVVKNYRKRLHCFRHSSDEAITERRSFSEEQKNFLIDFGLTIINAVHELRK